MEVEEVEVGSSPYDWLQRTAPDGFGMAVEIFLNGEPLARVVNAGSVMNPASFETLLAEAGRRPG